MVDIISRRDGPRREDERARRLISENRAAITQLADRLSQGGYSAGKAAKAAAAAGPQAEGKLIYDLGSGPARSPDCGETRIKISLNNRVVAYDGGSGRQVHLLGEIRWQEDLRYFALAVPANGFLAELPSEVITLIEELDGQIIDAACPESLLAEELAERLGYA